MDSQETSIFAAWKNSAVILAHEKRRNDEKWGWVKTLSPW
jgi:hypothetical protein